MRNQGEVLSAVWAERSLPVSSPGLPAAGKGKRNGGCEQKMRKVFHESTLGSGIAAVNPLFWARIPARGAIYLTNKRVRWPDQNSQSRPLFPELIL